MLSYIHFYFLKCLYNMALFTFEGDRYGEYAPILMDIYKYLGYFLILHILFSALGCKKAGFGLAGNFLNEDFLCSTTVIILSILAYHLVYKQVIIIK